MTERGSIWIARACVGVLVVGGLGILVAGRLGAETSSQQLLLIGLVAYGAVGYVVAVRRPDNPIPWLMLASAAIGGVFGVCQAVASLGLLNGAGDTWWMFLAWWPQNWLWMPLLMTSTTLPVLLFPDGHLPSRRWSPVAVAVVVITVAYVVPNALAARVGTAVLGQTLPNPLSPPFMARFGALDSSPYDAALQLAAAVTLVLAACSVVLRWRRAEGTERLQLRWFLLGATGLTAGIVLNVVVPAPWGNYLLVLGFVMLPVCMGVAVLRYRLYDIDRIISRTVSYAVVTGLLLLAYVVVVTSVSGLLGSRSSLGVAAATLAAAALFRPLIGRVQAVVDHRFDRARYDAALTVDDFGRRLRDQVDPDATAAELLDVVRRTVAPDGAALWLRDSGGAQGGGPS